MSERRWERVTYREKCGRCGALLKAGDPMLLIAFVGMKRALIRCEQCEGPAPPDLPERPEIYSVAELALQRIRNTAMTPVAQLPQSAPLPRLVVDNTAPREWLPYRETREPGEDDE